MIEYMFLVFFLVHILFLCPTKDNNFEICSDTTGYNDRGSHGASRQTGDRWESRSNRGNYGQFNEESGGNRDWSRSASSRSYSNKPPLRGTSDKKYDDPYYKDAAPPGTAHVLMTQELLY